MNNFQELENQESQRFNDVENRVLRKVETTKGMFHFFGDVIDLYIPQFIHFLVKLAGGSSDTPPDDNSGRKPPENKQPRYPNTQ